jgi:hypothetical protein
VIRVLALMQIANDMMWWKVRTTQVRQQCSLPIRSNSCDPPSTRTADTYSDWLL